MYLNPRALPPTIVVDAVPGAADLRDAAQERHREMRLAQRATVEASAAMAKLCSGPIQEAQPREDVTQAQVDAAGDARRQAQQSERQAERAYDRALAALHAHIRAGMTTHEFIAEHEAIAARAQSAVTDAMSALRAAFADRDLADSLASITRHPRNAAHDRRYTLDQAQQYVDAVGRTREDRAAIIRREAGIDAHNDRQIRAARSRR